MKNVDYIIVGDGFAGLFFAHQLIINGKSFLIFSSGERSASKVSAGIVNPVVLKKFTTFWKAQEQLDLLRKTLQEVSVYTGRNYLIEEPVRRIFHDENEKSNWIKKSADLEMSPFLSDEFQYFPVIKNDFGTGEVLQSARLDVEGFFAGMSAYLKDSGSFVKDLFDYRLLDVENSGYGGEITFSKIIFAEGVQVRDNPFFGQIPVQPNKGHRIAVKLHVPLPGNETFKKKHFLFKIKEDQYFYGGTYDRLSTRDGIDDSALRQLSDGLRDLYPHNFSMEETAWGFRPTVSDRRPILGNHSQYRNLFVFNGLGARGILNGCYFAKILYEFAENGTELPMEVSLKRFTQI